MPMCVAMKDFLGAGEDYVRNQLVDSSVFRNGQQLINQRYLRVATREEIESARAEEVDEPVAPRPVKKKKAGFKVKKAKG